jgi:hypothetical protein
VLLICQYPEGEEFWKTCLGKIPLSVDILDHADHNHLGFHRDKYPRFVSFRRVVGSEDYF